MHYYRKKWLEKLSQAYHRMYRIILYIHASRHVSMNETPVNRTGENRYCHFYGGREFTVAHIVRRK